MTWSCFPACSLHKRGEGEREREEEEELPEFIKGFFTPFPFSEIKEKEKRNGQREMSKKTRVIAIIDSLTRACVCV